MDRHDPELWRHRLDYLRTAIRRLLDHGLDEGGLRAILIAGLAAVPDGRTGYTWEDVYDVLREKSDYPAQNVSGEGRMRGVPA